MGDLVLRKTEVSDPARSHGKLALNWRGLTELSKLSETRLIRWQQWRGECCRELGHHKLVKILRVMYQQNVPICIDKSKYNRRQE
ncbi:hypothetical protein BHM03_00029500 [Ensete ventricosum]|nr:hypothetical protein BHM03_00029500 [Ensete ventricosum]